MKNFFMGMLTMYMVTALLFSISASYAGPKAMNGYGIAYYGLIWPAWPLSAMVDKLVVPIPMWMFDLDQ